jgi:hypothetical protein
VDSVEKSTIHFHTTEDTIMRSRLLAACALSALAALLHVTVPSTAQARESSEEICSVFGCPGGGQDCATLKGTVKYPGFVSLEVTYHCHKPKKEQLAEE